MLFKLFAIDCDGTLLNSDGVISERTISAVKNVITKNKKVVLASARPFYRMNNFIECLGLKSDDQYTIAFNGGMIANNTLSKVLFRKVFTADEVRQILTYKCTAQCNMLAYSELCVYLEKDYYEYRNNNPDAIFNITRFNEEFFENSIIYKIVFLISEKDFPVIYSNCLKLFQEKFEITSSGGGCIEFTPKGISKTKALQIIGKNCAITSEEMVAFGDGGNDISMIEYVGCGIAMGNATSEIKKSAKVIADTNDRDGVAKILENMEFKI